MTSQTVARQVCGRPGLRYRCPRGRRWRFSTRDRAPSLVKMGEHVRLPVVRTEQLGCDNRIDRPPLTWAADLHLVAERNPTLDNRPLGVRVRLSGPHWPQPRAAPGFPFAQSPGIAATAAPMAPKYPITAPDHPALGPHPGLLERSGHGQAFLPASPSKAAAATPGRIAGQKPAHNQLTSGSYVTATLRSLLLALPRRRRRGRRSIGHRHRGPRQSRQQYSRVFIRWRRPGRSLSTGSHSRP